MKVKFSNKGFNEFIERLAKMGQDVDPVVKDALLRSANVTQFEINKAASKHRHKGRMFLATIEPKLEQVNKNAYRVYVGFDGANDKEGLMHAIFLNYGTPKRKEHGQVEATHFFEKAIKRAAKKRKAILENIINEVGG